MSLIGDIRGSAEVVVSPQAELAALNLVGVTVDQLRTAYDELGQLADDLRWDLTKRREALSHVFSNAGLIAALDMRLIALRKWRDLYDGDRVIAEAHLFDAAAIASLVETDHGIGFDDARFGELVEFVAELPW